MRQFPATEILASKLAVLENFWHPRTIMQNSPVLSKLTGAPAPAVAPPVAQPVYPIAHPVGLSQLFPGSPSPSESLRAGGFQRAPGMGG